MSVAILIPCHNEAITIRKVITDFRAVLPEAEIHVCDNNCTDGTGDLAKTEGAKVWYEKQLGKGNAVRRLFREVEADWYLLVDGDATYEAQSALEMLRLGQEEGFDFVTGARVPADPACWRPGHGFGNRLLTGLVKNLVGDNSSDLLSGYRLLSRRFVASFPALASGFDVETDMVVHALDLALPAAEVSCPYYARPHGSFSKLHTWRDGWRILKLILNLVRHERPLPFFLILASLLAVLSLALGIPVVLHYEHTGTVPRLPTALLAASAGILAAQSLFTGFVLDTVTRGRKEQKRLAFRQA